jgi:hypothetical protein
VLKISEAKTPPPAPQIMQVGAIAMEAEIVGGFVGMVAKA